MKQTLNTVFLGGIFVACICELLTWQVSKAGSTEQQATHHRANWEYAYYERDDFGFSLKLPDQFMVGKRPYDIYKRLGGTIEEAQVGNWEILNQLGGEGWELISHTESQARIVPPGGTGDKLMYVLKRQTTAQ